MNNESNAAGTPVSDATQTVDKAYRPKKEERNLRYRLYRRYYYIKDDPLRVLAEEDWEEGDKMFSQDVPTPDSDDWRAHLTLPDSFAAIQAQMQETIDRNSRPYLRRVEDSDKGIETFQNSVLTYNLNRTGFDYQYFLAKYSAAIRGTAYIVEKYRLEKRKIKDPSSVNADGSLVYVDKEVVDYDDSYTEWIPNESVFIDPAAKHIDEARDYILREVMDVDEFKRAYGFRADCINIDIVKRGGDTSTKSYFQFPHDMAENDVEVLHWYNRSTDEYTIAANNIIIRIGPIPFKHKELNIAPIFHYTVPGRMYGLGIPRIIKTLSAERASIRNLNMDRQKMQLNKMFLTNDQVDFDEDELVTRPHGMVEVSTNGLSIRDAIMPLEYGDVPASYFRTEEILLEDIRRAHGIDDRIQGNASGGTATEAAILKETASKRIGLVAKLAEMDAIRRIGRLKWSNIQFFYPTPKIERITEDNDDREEKTYRKISVDGNQFQIVKDKGTNKTKLKVNEIEGSTTFKLNPAMARYMEGDFDVYVDIESATVTSKAIQQAKITEMFTAIAAIPNFLQELDPRKALTQILEVNDQLTKNWLKGSGKSVEEMQELAEWENQVMAQGQMLSPTDGADEQHTLIHLYYTKTDEFKQLPPGTQTIIMNHIMGEHDANPTTGSVAADLGGAASPPGLSGPPPGQQATPGMGPSIPGANMQPSTVTGEAPNSSSNQSVGPVG